MTAARLDLIIEKGTKFYRELDLVDQDGDPYTLVGREVKATFRESLNTTTALNLLTEGNGGVIVLDDALGKVALYISATDTQVTPDFGVYDVVVIDSTHPLLDVDRVLEGRVTYTKGVTA